MSADGLELMLLWTEAGLSLASVVVFLWAAASLLSRIRSGRRPLVQSVSSSGNLQTNQPLFFRGALKSLRSRRIRHFRNVSQHVIEDSHQLLQSSTSFGRIPNYEARTMLPLVSEARRFGERLLAERRKYHAVLWKNLEKDIEPTLLRLLELECRLREIPRAVITLDDVTAGRFE